MLDHRIADHELQPRGNWHELEIKRAAVEKKSVTSLSHAGDELIHDADLGANKGVLRGATQFGDFGQRQSGVIQAEYRQSRRYFQSSRRAQTCADWHFSMHEQVRAGEFVPLLPQD